jgi:hypothetical protein
MSWIAGAIIVGLVVLILYALWVAARERDERIDAAAENHGNE